MNNPGRLEFRGGLVRRRPLVVGVALALVLLSGSPRCPGGDPVAGRQPASAGVPAPKSSAPTLPGYLDAAPSWVSGPRCGPNCLFVLLKLRGLAANFDEVTARCRVSPQTGCSLDDLQRAAEESGLPAETRFVSPTAMTTLKMPFIAHLSPSDEYSASGHFLVVFAYRPETGDLGVIDGTSSNYSYRNLGALSRSLSGYVLLPREGEVTWLKFSFVGEILMLGAVVARRLASPRRTP